MKKFLLHLFGALLIVVSLQSQPKNNITIRVVTENLPTGSKVYIAGNDSILGNWQPNVLELKKTSENKWIKSFSFKIGKRLEFKITRGSWDTEALDDNGLIPSNHVIEVFNDTTVEIKVKLWADMVQRKTEGPITGIVKYHLNFSGEGIKSRDIIVWLPPFYFLEKEKRYPVLYIHDGQNIVNQNTSTFRVDWQIDETADSLIRQGMIEDIIIVGINNTTDRSSEYSENDTGYAYMNFIVDSLKPFIDRNYRTRKEREFTATAGSSLGGLITFMLIWEHPEVFSMAACISPALNIGRYNFVDNVSSYLGVKKKIKIYIDIGDDELDSKLQPGINEMLLALDAKGFLSGIDYYYFKDKNAQHNEKYWARRIWRALVFFFGTEKGKSLL